VALQLLIVRVVDRVRTLGDLGGEIEHRLVPRREISLAIIDGDLIGDQRILGADAQDRAMGDDAILAVVDTRRRHHNHLALGFAQAAGLFHQRVMIGKEGAELVRPPRERKKDIGDKARLFLHRFDPLANVLRQIG
jgi:hypothetical protein